MGMVTLAMETVRTTGILSGMVRVTSSTTMTETLEMGSERIMETQSAMGIARSQVTNGEKFWRMASRKDSVMTAGRETLKMNETVTIVKTAVAGERDSREVRTMTPSDSDVVKVDQMEH